MEPTCEPGTDGARAIPRPGAGPCRRLLIALAGLGLLAAGCRTPGPTAKAFTFYPPPPEPARFQYLTSINNPSDVLEPPSALATFLFGPAAVPAGIGKPYGLALKNGKLYVSDTSTATIHLIDLRKKTWDFLQPEGAGRLRKNIAVAVHDDGTLYVSDTMRGQVVVFGANARQAGVLGEPGELKPAGLEVVGDQLYVTDMKGRRVVVYDVKSRAAVRSIPAASVTNEAERLFQPVGVAVDAEGRVYVSDVGAFHIQVYDAEGRYVRSISRHGDGVGEFVRNKGIALDRAHRLYAVDAGFKLVQLYDDQDRLLLYFGDPEAGEEGRMDLPADIVVDYDHVDLFRKYVAPGRDIEFIVLVSNQFGGRKITVYGYLKPVAPNGP